MVSLLWQRETEGQVFDSPERRATLDKTLREALMRIRDPSIRGHYGEEIKRLRWELFGTKPAQAPLRARHLPPQGRTAAARRPPRAARLWPGGRRGPVGESMLEAVLLATLCLHPALILPLRERAGARIEFTDETHAFVQSLMLRLAHRVPIEEIPREDRASRRPPPLKRCVAPPCR